MDVIGITISYRTVKKIIEAIKNRGRRTEFMTTTNAMLRAMHRQEAEYEVRLEKLEKYVIRLESLASHCPTCRVGLHKLERPEMKED